MKKETILLVEDDEASLNMLVTHFEKNYHVLVATNGIEAVYAYDHNIEAIVAVVTDLDLPHLDGAELAEWIRHVNPVIPIIIMSAGLANGKISRLRRQPGIGVVWKPFLPEQLEEMLNGFGVISISPQRSAILS